MNKTIPKFLIPMLIIFAVGLYGQDQCQIANCNHVITAGDQHGHCPTCDVELNGETEFEDHCTNNEDHCPEPSGDGGSGGGPPQAGDECDLCDHVYSGDEDHHGHCPAPTCDVVLDTDEDWEEHCNDDPDHCPEPPDGDDGYEEYGEHTVGNCIAFAEGRGSYWIGDEEFAVWDDPNVDCNYLFDQIGYQPPAYMCSWTWGDGNPCGYTSKDPDDSHQHCDQVFPDGNPCGASFDNEGDMDAHQDDHADDGGDGGDHPGGGPPQAGDECDLCDHVYSGDEDHHGHCPAPTCDVVLDTDEDWEEHCNDDPDHCPEPSGDGGSGGGPPQAGDECDLCDHVYSGDEDHHGHCPAPTCDVVLDTDEDWEEHCNDDPDHCPEPPDGD